MKMTVNAITLINSFTGVSLPTCMPIKDMEPDAGVIGPGSITWKIHSEQWLVLGSAAALLLQTAHPVVAQAVVDHSAGATDPFGRFYRTYTCMAMLLCGSTREAHASAHFINQVHHRVSGTLQETIGNYHAGDRYCARDSAPSLWVHVAFIESMLTAYRTFVGPLSADDCEQYWQESRQYAHLLGLTDVALPATYSDMQAYFHDAIARKEVIVGEAGRVVAAMVLHPPLPMYRRLMWALVRLIAVGQLPVQIREGYGLRWSRRNRFVFGLVTCTCRFLRLHLQRILGHSPMIAFAERRAHGELGKSAIAAPATLSSSR
jgi:uncharacterized protein (DUF2236 family)